MNNNNLHELINRYESDIDRIYDKDHYELFKWKAMKTWRDEWFKPEDSFTNFAERYIAAKRDFSLFIDNSRMHPSTGVLKLWEKDPVAVEHLFKDVLFADAVDAVEAQRNMDSFVDQYEKLRQEYYAGNWSYKQDRHSASVYMAMNAPDFNYVFKSSEALIMARYIEFGLRIGSGSSFSLENYYRMCDGIVDALREHTSLLEKHFSRLKDVHYYDESLHLLAFDLMYCSDTYGYYHGLVAPVTGKTIRKAVKKELSETELKEQEALKEAQLQKLQQELEKLERSVRDYEDISLIDVQVTSDRYGSGTVIEQTGNKIKVRFSEVEKSFVLDQKYAARPRFENDDVVVAAFTEYGRTQEQIDKIRKELDALVRE